MQTLTAEQFRQKYGTQAYSDLSKASLPAQNVQQQSTDTSVVQRLSDVGTQAGNDIKGAIQGTGQFQDQSPVRRGVEAVATASSVPIQGAVALAPQPVRQGIEAVGNVIGTGFKKLTDFIGSNPDVQKLTQNHPEITKALEEVAGTLGAGGQIAGNILTVDGAAKVAQKGADVTSSVIDNTTKNIANTTNDALAWGKTVNNDLKATIGNKTVDPQLKASVERIPQNGLDAAKVRVENPVSTYDTYLQQSKSATKDIKVDPAISTVGEKIGNAFGNVVKQRQAVGKVLGSELKTFADKPVDIGSPVSQFQQDLIDSGATYDRLAKKVSAGDTSKFTQTDVRLLQKYAEDLSALGTNPTAAKVDAFISRIPNEIKELKSSGGVNTMTNAERIITKNVNEMRTPLSEVATPAYNTARTAYSNLSNFVNEGGKFLGKITQSGDFAKDASIAKSAVQSILNNGKKDWLLKLEGLTGYNALDDSVLALQAMKDAGDFRGLSLLETLNEGTIPTSQAGLWGKVLQYGFNLGSKVVAGTPEEQTRAFLKSISQPKQK